MKQKIVHEFRIASMLLQVELEVNDECIPLTSFTTQNITDFSITPTSEIRHVGIFYDMMWHRY
jgi:hypothetical protein